VINYIDLSPAIGTLVKTFISNNKKPRFINNPYSVLKNILPKKEMDQFIIE
jgi:hypothetical protein